MGAALCMNEHVICHELVIWTCPLGHEVTDNLPIIEINLEEKFIMSSVESKKANWKSEIKEGKS